MPHVTFIHGISNKPPAGDLLRIWDDALSGAEEPLALGDLGVTSSMVYWADLLYEKPEEDLTAFEGVLENTPEAVDGGGEAAPPVPGSKEEAVFLEALRARLTTTPDTLDEPEAVGAPAPGALERVPLPWFLKKRFLDRFLRDVHHYLFDVEFALPGREAVHIQQTIRRRFVEAVGASDVTRPHVVVSHSMGTVIAYDCLKRVADCWPVDGLITIGSPLGIDEIQDRLQPEWTRRDGFPSDRVGQSWANLFDRLDPVCGFNPVLARDFQRDGTATIEDIPVQNSGAWRHSATKYLRQPQFCRTLRQKLEIG